MPIETDWTIPVAQVPQNGLRFARTATAVELGELALVLDVLACSALSCDLRVKPLRQGRYRVEGQVTATVTQACVVSLEPVIGQVTETIDVEFWPREQIKTPVNMSIEDDPEAQSSPTAESFDQGRITIGQLIYECVASGIDPYPRKPGATLEWTTPLDVEVATHPFAGLAKLKTSDTPH